MSRAPARRARKNRRQSAGASAGSRRARCPALDSSARSAELGRAYGRRGGFTLLEVLVAIAIIATALVSLLSLHGRNIEIVAHDQRLNRATLLAQGLMTRTLTAERFPDPAQASGDFESDPDFHWQVEILRGPARELEEEMREIRLRVFWDGGDADAVRLVTLIRRPDR